MNAWRPCAFEVFLQPTCPFSVRAFGKLEDLLDKAGEDRITVPRVRLQSQPWHVYPGVIARCILAASTLEGGKTAGPQPPLDPRPEFQQRDGGGAAPA